MGAIAAAGALYLAATIQTSVAARLAIGPAVPDFVLILVVCIGLLRGPTAGTWAGFGGGLFYGLLQPHAGALAGLTIATMLAGLLAGRQRRWLRVEHRLAAPISVLGLTLVAGVVAWLLSRPAQIGHGFKLAAAGSVYNALLSPVIFALVRRADARLHPREE